jgi:hypothetical protein
MHTDIYEEEMDWREKEWDEPGPDFGAVARINRRTREIDLLPYEEE